MPKALNTLQLRPTLKRLQVGLALLTATFYIAGCANTATSALPPLEINMSPSFREAEAANLVVSQTVSAQWWESFNDPALSALVLRGQASNVDVRIALERVREARAGLDAADSRLLPTLSFSGGVSDQRTNLSDEVKRGSPDTRVSSGAVEVNWEIDLFGAASAAADASDADALASEAAVAAAQLVATTEVARHYLIWQGAKARETTLLQLLQTQTKAEQLTRSREASGEASAFDVSRAIAQTQSLAAQIPAIGTLAAVTEHQLAVLLGASPGGPILTKGNLQTSVLHNPPVFSPGQPADLLWRRPDLHAASLQWQAASARVREAQADRWPRLFLAAAVGQQDLQINALNLSTAAFSNVALAFTAPIFNAGRLRAAVQRQAARERTAWLQMEAAVLRALQDVEVSLALLRGERERATALGIAAQQQRVALRHTESMYREGQVGLLPLLEAQRGRLAAELALIDSQTQVALATVQLVKALGGGWAAQTSPQSPLTCAPTC